MEKDPIIKIISILIAILAIWMLMSMGWAEEVDENSFYTFAPQGFNALAVYSPPNIITLDKKYFWGVEWIEDKEDEIIIHLKVKEPEEVK